MQNCPWISSGASVRSRSWCVRRSHALRGAANRRRQLTLVAALVALSASEVNAATIRVPAGGNLQSALNAAQPGDTILLDAGAEYVGNFILPAKTGDAFITVRSATSDALLPGSGVRIAPSHRALLARLRSPNAMSVLRTAPSAHHWRLRYLEFAGNADGRGDIIALGDGSSAQNALDLVPHDLVLDHLYVHGDRLVGQKRCVALNAAAVTVRDSHVSDCKGVGMDTQALAGWNGPGPFTIENNYLEGAGENVLFGGADPAIAGLVPTGITFRRNYVSRPMDWRNPIVSTPAGVTASVVTAGGTLAPGTYAYRIIARRPAGQGTTARSKASDQVIGAVTAGGQAIRITWRPVPGASEYQVYGRVPGGQSMYWTVAAPEFVDAGAPGASEAVPTAGETYWLVKNLFELKNARNVIVEQNVFENHWKQAQAGYAIVFTPRNSGGACTWCGLDNVTFQFNIVRHVAAGLNVLGYDVPSEPTRQTVGLTIRHNLFHDVSTAYGGNGWFLLIGDEPRGVTVEHNTVDFDGSTAVYAYGGTTSAPRLIREFRFINNALRHNRYGINGASSAFGNTTLSRYFPDAVVQGNWLQGGSASNYPAGNLFAGTFGAAFVDAAGADYRLSTGSVLLGRATDGSNVGADVLTLLSGAPPMARLAPPIRPGGLRVVQ